MGASTKPTPTFISYIENVYIIKLTCLYSKYLVVPDKYFTDSYLVTRRPCVWRCINTYFPVWVCSNLYCITVAVGISDKSRINRRLRRASPCRRSHHECRIVVITKPKVKHNGFATYAFYARPLVKSNSFISIYLHLVASSADIDIT